MTIAFKRAVREKTSLLFAIAGPSGCGKTYSALLLARGLVGPSGKIAVIDTEAGRALHYAGTFDFDHAELQPPFRPSVYEDAVSSAEKAGYDAIIIDSMSHEHEGIGGTLEWADAIEAGGTRGAAKWKLPKDAHKKMMQRFLQCRAHLIFCLRADEKIKITSERKEAVAGFYKAMAGTPMSLNDQVMQEKAEEHAKGISDKTVIIPLGWTPICEKRFMYEMTASFLMLPDAPGIPRPIKLQEQHSFAFPFGEKISVKSGERLAAWVRGGVAPPVDLKVNPPTDNPPSPDQKWLSELLASMQTKMTVDDLNALMDHPNVIKGLANRPSIAGDAQAARHHREMQIEALAFVAETEARRLAEMQPFTGEQ